MKKLFKNIKRFIAHILLPDEVKVVEMERNAFIQAREQLKKAEEEHIREVNAFNEHAKNVTITDMVREQLKGFDPKSLDDPDNDLPGILGDVEDQNAFLGKMKTLRDMPELTELLDFMTREQVLYSAKEAQNVEQLNFGRATINGLALVREEVARLAAVYEERHAKEEEFDEFEVT